MDREHFYVTSTHYTNEPVGGLMPMYPAMIASAPAKRMMDAGYADKVEIAKRPMLFQKKYYPGCLWGKENQKLIIRRHGGIGDIIWTLATARLLKEQHKGLDIKYCVMDKDRELFNNLGYTLTKRDQIDMAEANEADWILDYFYSVEGYNEAASRDPYDISFNWAFGAYPVKPIDVKGLLVCDANEKAYASKILGGKKTIAVCTQSSNPKRSYTYTEALINRFSKDMQVVVLGGRPYETQAKCLNMCGKTSVREMIAILEAVDYVVTVDTGSLHIAATFDKPIIALFTTVNYKTRTKYYDKVVPIQSPKWCSPCLKLAEHCAIDGECMACIKTDTVIKEYEKWLSI